MATEQKLQDLREAINKVIYTNQSNKISKATVSKMCLTSQQKQCADITSNEKVLSEIIKINNINKKLDKIEKQLKADISKIRRPEFISPELCHPMNFLEDLMDFIEEIPAEYRTLETVVDCLQGDAYSWAMIFKERWSTIEDFKKDFLEQYWSQAEQNLLRREIVSAVYDCKSETMTQHFTYHVAQAKLLTNQIAEEVLVFDIMQHFSRHVNYKWFLERRQGGRLATPTVLAATSFLDRMDKILPDEFKSTEVRPRIEKPRRFRTLGDGTTVDLTDSDEDDDDDDYEEPKMGYNKGHIVGASGGT